MFATGRKPYPSIDSADRYIHRSRAVDALLTIAHDDDTKRLELQRQLNEIDRAIERGVALLPEAERRRFLLELYEVQQEQPNG